MSSAVEKLTGLAPREQLPPLLVGFGHAGTHWIIGTFYLLLPFVQRDLEFSYVEAGALVTVFHLSSFLANLGSGAVVDMTGRRVVVQAASLLVGALALMACGGAGGTLALAVLVGVMGVTNNLWHPAAISFLSRRYPRTRGYVLSVHTLGASLGDSMAPVAVGATLVWLGWREAAVVSALPVLALAVVLVLGLARLDRARGDDRTAAGTSLGAYLGGVKTLVCDRSVLGLALMTGFRNMAQAGLLVFVPLYLANVLEVGPFLTGVGVMLMQAGGLVAGPIAGTLSDRLGRRRIVLAGLSGSTLAILALTLSGNEVLFIAGISVLGFMLFAVRPVIHSWMMDLTPPALAGSATSVLFGAQAGFAMLAPLVGGVIADGVGMVAVFYALGASMLVANALAYLLPDVASRRD